MERDFCILIHTVRIQTTVSLYSSSPHIYRNRESFYHVIIPSAQWSWRWVYWFHLVRPSIRLHIILHVILRIMAGMRRIGNAEIFSALSLCYGWNADIMRRFLHIPVRILPSAFSQHFFPYKNAEISPRSCPNTPIRIFSAFPPHFFPYKNAEIFPRSCPNTPIRIFSARKMRRSGVRAWTLIPLVPNSWTTGANVSMNSWCHR